MINEFFACLLSNDEWFISIDDDNYELLLMVAIFNIVYCCAISDFHCSWVWVYQNLSFKGNFWGYIYFQSEKISIPSFPNDHDTHVFDRMLFEVSKLVWSRVGSTHIITKIDNWIYLTCIDFESLYAAQI